MSDLENHSIYALINRMNRPDYLFYFFCDFINSYQYELYRSWVSSEKLDGDLPAGFTSEKVVRCFLDRNSCEINVEYDWQNWKINSQREMVPFLFYIDDKQEISSYINFIEKEELESGYFELKHDSARYYPTHLVDDRQNV